MPVDQIRYKAGQMISFVAARSFALGSTGANVSRGSEVLFDGTRAEVDGGTYTLPQLRGAVKSGWLVLADGYDENDLSAERPVAANVQVRHAAQGGNPMNPNRAPTHAMTTTENDEREVNSSITRTASDTRQRNTGYRRGQPVNSGATVRSQRGFEVVEDQDGVEVPGRTLKTKAGEKAKQERTVLTSDSAGRAIQEANSVKIEPGRGLNEEDMLEQMSEEDRELYLAEKAALKSKYVDEPEVPRRVGKVRATARTETREGITSTVSTGGGIETADPSYGGKAQESVVTEDGITFRTTNGPGSGIRQPAESQVRVEPKGPPMDISGSIDVRRQIAMMVCPDFPANYDFNQTPRKKIARLQADYEDRPDVIRAVFAAEGDEFKQKLVEEFASAFGK